MKSNSYMTFRNTPPLSSRCLSRRTFLRATGVGFSLPWLDAMQPAIAHESTIIQPRRMVLINKALGLHGPDFFPKQMGHDFELTSYLKEFSALRGDFTVFSGLSHPEAGGGHSSEQSFLTAAPHSGTPAFRNTISLDQLVAEQISDQTRHSFLALGSHMAASPGQEAVCRFQRTKIRLLSSVVYSLRARQRKFAIKSSSCATGIAFSIPCERRPLPCNVASVRAIAIESISTYLPCAMLRSDYK